MRTDPNELAGQLVRVHRLRSPSGWAILTRGDDGRWRDSAFAREVVLGDVRPRIGSRGKSVQLAMNEHQRRSGVRLDGSGAPHAYLEGTLRQARVTPRRARGERRITYSPESGFAYASGAPFLGAAQVTMIATDAGSCVLAQGRAARENPPACPCRIPGGECSCGKVDSEEPAPSCNDPGGREGVACVSCGPALVLLDVYAVRRMGPDAFWEDSCPAVLAFGGPSGQAHRRGWEGAIAAHAKQVGKVPLSWVCSHVGGTPERVAEHLLSNGRDWIRHVQSNPPPWALSLEPAVGPFLIP